MGSALLSEIITMWTLSAESLLSKTSGGPAEGGGARQMTDASRAFSGATSPPIGRSAKQHHYQLNFQILFWVI